MAKLLENHMQEINKRKANFTVHFFYLLIFCILSKTKAFEQHAVSVQEISHSVKKDIYIIVASFNFEVPYSNLVFFLSFQIPQNWTYSVVSS